WTRSIGVLSEILGDVPVSASVPYGYFSARVAKAAANSGIRWLFTSEPTTRVSRVAGCAVVGRYNVRADVSSEQVSALIGSGSRARRMQYLSWNARKVLKMTAGPGYNALRSMLLRSRQPNR